MMLTKNAMIDSKAPMIRWCSVGVVLTLLVLLCAQSLWAQEMNQPHHVRVNHALQKDEHAAKRVRPSSGGKAAPSKNSNTSSAEPFNEDESNGSLAPELMAIASQIYTGRLQCELGEVVVLLPIQELPGRFQLTLKKQKYLMTPSLTPTGAVKLEDKKLGAFWIQLGNKSMLFNSKLGQRMADECQGPGQQAVAMRERVSPPPSLLEPLP